MRRIPAFSYGWVVLAVAFVVMALGFGLRNAFSVFYPAIVEEFDWSRGSTALMFSLNILVYGFMAPVGGGLVDRFKPGRVIALGACILGGGIALCSLATTQWQFYLLYGLVVAAGLSMIGVAPLSAVVMPWFAGKRGLVFSILAAGFGLSLVMASLAQYLISSYGWRSAYVIMGLGPIAIVAPLCLVLLRRAPLRIGSQPPDTPATSGMTGSHGSGETSGTGGRWSVIGWTLSRALKTHQFWVLFFIGFCQIGLAEKIAIAHQVYIFRDAGYDPMTAATIYSVFGIAFVVGNLCGSLSDRLGREKVFVPGCMLSTGAVFLLFLIKDSSQPWMAFLFAVCFGLGLGVMPPVLFAVVADLFHGESFGSIQGFIVLGISLGGAISPWLAGLLYDRTGSYVPSFYLLIGSLLACGVMMWLLAPRKLRPVQPGAPGGGG